MGKKKTKKNKNLTPIKVTFTTYEERCKLPREPKIIPKEIFHIISDYMLQLPPVHRNVFVSMSTYNIDYINPNHVITEDGPTHVMIFCLRLITSDHFNPIGVILIDDRLDQSEKLAIAWKAFLQDLAILRLIVVATISTATTTFHNVLSILTKNPNLENYTDPIIYTVWPYQQILHLYDYHNLMVIFQEFFYHSVDVFFITSGSDDPMEPASHEFKLFSASWTDILLILAVAGTECMYTNRKSTNYIPIFSSYYRQIYYDNSKGELIRTETKPSTDRLLRSFWMFGGIADENIDLELDCLEGIYEHNEDLRFILATARFRPSKITRPTQQAMFSKHIVDAKDDVSSDNAIELGNNQMKNILSGIDDAKQSVTPFDIFLRQIVYDKQEFLNKQPPGSLNSNALNALFHDNECISKEFPGDTKKHNGCNGLKEDDNNVLGDLMLISYETPKMAGHNCENCEKGLCKLTSSKENTLSNNEIKNNLLQRITNTFADKKSDLSNRTIIDSLDLANIEGDIFGTLTKSVMDTAMQDFSNILSSYENALQQKTNSLDSLAEHNKYVIPKSKTAKNTYARLNRKGISKSPIEELESLLGQINGGQQSLPTNSNPKNSLLASCCVMPSTSSIHSPSFETISETTTSLTHYVSSCGDDFDQSNKQETEKVNEIDYQEYRKQLLATFCDKEQSECDIIFKDRDNYNKLFNSIPKDCYPQRISTDWLCTLKGYLKLKELLEHRKVARIRSNLLCIEHIDHFVRLVRKYKNGLLSPVFEGYTYSFINYKCSFELLNPKGGIYMITPDDDEDDEISMEIH